LKGCFYGIGVGPGEPELLTLKAVNVLKEIDILALPESKKEKGSVAFDIAKPYLKDGFDQMVLTFPMITDEEKKKKLRYENALLIKEQLDKGKNVGFLTLGDPMIYSTFVYLLEYLKEFSVKTEIVPGITSFSAIAAKLGIPIVIGDEKFAIVSNFDNNTEKIAELFDCIVFMKISSYKNEFIDLLKKIKGRFYLVSNVGKPNEKVITELDDLINEEITYFSTLILYKI